MPSCRVPKSWCPPLLMWTSGTTCAGLKVKASIKWQHGGNGGGWEEMEDGGAVGQCGRVGVGELGSWAGVET